jgi:hypothetical protein
MRLPMKLYATDGVLAGSIEGQRAFTDLLQKTPAAPTTEVCFLDFRDVNVATTRFLRDSIVAYRNHARANWPNIYPVAANLEPRVREDLEVILKARGDAFVICCLDQDGRASSVELIGQIDGKQLVALQEVILLGEADAPSLAARADEKVAPTAWNNRLGALAAKGILIEISSGRSKRYRPVLEGMQYGT